MRVLAFDPFVSAERYRELGVEKAANSEEIYAQADFITIHLPKTPETRRLARRRGVRARCATACGSSTSRAAG